MASMEKEFFWGCELSKDKKEYSWDCEDKELSKADIEQKLVLSQACLGSKAKANEKNLVQATTIDSSDNSVTFTILSLTSGKTDQCRISLGFPSSVTFKLIEGSGPVHLTGAVYQELYLLDEERSDDEDDEFVKSEAKVASKKRPLASETPKGPPKKLARVEADDEEESDEEDDDDDDEDESTEESTKMEVDIKPKQKKTEETPKTARNKPESKDAKVKKKNEEEEESDDDEEEDSEEESDDEDEEEDDESDEDESDEDDDDDEEDEESDEEDEIATSLTAKKKQGGKGEQKKPITNGVAKVDKPSKTPTQQQPSTPKTGVKKTGGKTPEPLDMDKIKEKLLKTPNLPKKVEKFKNYMKHGYKVTDDAELTKLWDWLKANK
ncbi:uncharacterized protein LOC144642807 isoform X1 [Oculina patagonica]